MGRLQYWVPILTYHRIGEFRGDHVPTVSPEAFEQQMRWLARLRVRVISLNELLARLEQGKPLPRWTTAITFDDGYEGCHSRAWPILKRFGFCATVFVAPDDVSTPGFVTWEQAKEMASNGIAIGSHTTSQAYLPLTRQEQLPHEIIGSKQAIEAQLGKPVRHISYPVGGFTHEVTALAREAGYEAGYTTNRALPGRAFDRYAIRRIKMTERDANPIALLAKLSGYYDLFRQLDEPS